MHFEISVLKRATGALTLTVVLLLGAGVTNVIQAQKGAKPEKQVAKTEHKMEGTALKTHQREERVALKTHQRAERQAFKQSSRSRHRNLNHDAHKRCVKECNRAHK